MPSLTKIQTGFLEPQGAFELTPGTSSSPGLFFTGDTSTGMFSPSSGVLGFSTGSTQQALTILADGKVGIGTDNPTNAALHVEGRNFSFGGPGSNNSGEGNLYIGNYNNPLLDSWDRNIRIGSKNEIQIELYTDWDGTQYSDSIIFSSPDGLGLQFNGNKGGVNRSGIFPLNYNAGTAITDDYLFFQAGNKYLWFDADTGRLGINRSSGSGWSDTLDVNGTARVTGIAKFDSSVGIGTVNPTDRLHIIGHVGGSNPSDGQRYNISRFVSSYYVPANSGGLTIGAYWNNTDANGRRAFIQSSQGTDSGSTARDLLLNPDGGNVGIGTDNPNFKLQVEGGGAYINGGALEVSDGSSPTLWLDAQDNNWPAIIFTGTPVGGSAGTQMGSVGFGGSTNQELEIWSEGTVALKSTSYSSTDGLFVNNNNVGIGTNNPQEKFHLFASTSATQRISNTSSSAYNTIQFVNDSNYYGYLWQNGSAISAYGGPNALHLANYNGPLVFSSSSSGSYSQRAIIDTSGNVGIGTTNPGTKLSIYDTTGNHITLSNSWSSGSHAISFLGGSHGGDGTSPNSTAARIVCTATAPGGAATGDLKFVTNSGDNFVNALYISPNGNIGISTTNPSEKLDVNGNIVTSKLYSGPIATKTTNNVYRIQISNGTNATYQVDEGSDVAIKIGSGYIWNVNANSSYNGMRIGTNWDGVTGQATGSLPSWDIDIGGRNAAETGSDCFTVRRYDSSWVNLLTVKGTGNVGIGTTNPGSLLDLKTDTGVDPTTPTTLRISTSTVNTTGWSTSNPWGVIDFYSDNFASGLPDSGPKVHARIAAVASSSKGRSSNLNFELVDGISSSTRSTILSLSTGGVGVNRTFTLTPTNDISAIYKNSSDSECLYLRTSSTQVTWESRGGKNFVWSQGFATSLILNSSGNVGIGTNNPSHKLHVSGSLYSTSRNINGYIIEKVGERLGTGTYTIFTNGNNSTQSGGIVEVMAIYGTPSGVGYWKYKITGNRNIYTIESNTTGYAGSTPSVTWNGATLEVSNSNGSVYYTVKVQLYEIGNSWVPTWGNLPGINL